MDKKFTDAFMEEIRTQLIAGKSVSIKGLGTFATEHKKQNQISDKNGRIMLEPPADVITFNPESTTS